MKKENEDGYEYCERLYKMIMRNKKHTLPLDEAVDFISYYGLKYLFFASGKIGFIGKIAIDRLDHDLTFENYRLVKKSNGGDTDAK